MFDYTLSKKADYFIFKKACTVIESKIKNFSKKKLLIDVDSSAIQIYKTENGEIIIYNDYEVDAVYVKSEIDILEITELLDKIYEK